MYHIVYLTTNLINNKIYIGIRSTYNLNDGYLGSGTLLRKSIKKYGKDNFKRQILYYCLSRIEALHIESQIVDKNFIKRTNVYNLTLGGASQKNINMSQKNPTHKKYWRDLGLNEEEITIKFKEHHNKYQQMTPEIKEKISKANTGKKHTTEFKEKAKLRWLGKHHTEESKQKMRVPKGTFSEEHKLKLSEAAKNRPKRVCSEETKRKIGEANRKK